MPTPMPDAAPESPNSPNSSLSASLAQLQRLIDIVAQLRNPDGGCPWDLKQTPQSLIPYVIEEAYEVVDAIQEAEVTGDQGAIAEELGDLLLQVVLQAQVAQDAGDFDLSTVAEGIADKLVRRHPHVFGDVETQDLAEIHRTWETIKAAEKADSEDPNQLSPKLTRYARSLPPLTAASKISRKAAKAGFEWENLAGVWDKFEEELGEFRHAIAHESPERQEAELGDLLFTLVNIARWQGLDPSAALQGTNRRFIQRFAQVEAAIGNTMEHRSPAELEALWQQAKAKLTQADPPVT
jgi:XTP/dITP diphosphohydrolase